MKKCTNCGNESESKYCPGCGQAMEIKRLEVAAIFHDITHGILHWENSILKTFRDMLTKPGDSTRNYISGMRKTYVKPFSYFIFIQTIYVLLFHRMSGDFFAFLNISIKTTESMQGKIAEMQHLINAFINYLNYFLPVFFALYFYLFFRKKTGINYAESLATAFYWTGTTLVFGIAVMLLSIIDIRIWNLRFLINFIYLIFAVMKFTETGVNKRLIKSILIFIFSYATYALFVSGITLLILIFKYRN